jgi:hypothetical protein
LTRGYVDRRHKGYDQGAVDDWLERELELIGLKHELQRVREAAIKLGACEAQRHPLREFYGGRAVGAGSPR